MPQSDYNLMVAAIRAGHHCEAEHIESVPVTEVFKGQVAWDGVVEVFKLSGHPKAKRAFAWKVRDGTTTTTTAVLEIPPVDGPQTAVKLAIAAKARGH